METMQMMGGISFNKLRGTVVSMNRWNSTKINCAEVNKWHAMMQLKSQIHLLLIECIGAVIFKWFSISSQKSRVSID